MAASLRSTRSVVKAELPNRVGGTGYRLSGRILTVNAPAAIPFRLWKLRAAASVDGLCRDQGRHTEAGHPLAPVCGWFTEGFDTI